MSQGTDSSDLFLVLDGELTISVGREGEERNVATLAPGSMFGEVSLLDPGPAGATIATEQGCVALRLSRDRFDELGASNPPAAGALLGQVMRSLSERTRAAAQHLGGDQ